MANVSPEVEKILQKRLGKKSEEIREHLKELGNNRISSTYDAIDELVSGLKGSEGGGFQRERCHEIVGATNCGKSLICKRMASQPGINAVYIDSEHSFDGIEADMYDFLIIPTSNLEKAYEVMQDLLLLNQEEVKKTGKPVYDVIFCDSLAGLGSTQTQEAGTEFTMNDMLNKQKVMSLLSGNFNAYLEGSQCAVIFTNHLTESMSKYGHSDTTGSGNRYKYYLSERVFITNDVRSKSNQVLKEFSIKSPETGRMKKQDPIKLGHWLRCEHRKSRVNGVFPKSSMYMYLPLAGILKTFGEEEGYNVIDQILDVDILLSELKYSKKDNWETYSLLKDHKSVLKAIVDNGQYRKVMTMSAEEIKKELFPDELSKEETDDKKTLREWEALEGVKILLHDGSPELDLSSLFTKDEWSAYLSDCTLQEGDEEFNGEETENE